MAERQGIGMTKKPSAAQAGEADAVEPKARDDWELMDSAPLDGRAVIVTDDKFQLDTEAYYRTTKQFVSKTGKWEDRSFWAVRNAAGRSLPFEPAAWRPL
jgi:hypothetical protein